MNVSALCACVCVCVCARVRVCVCLQRCAGLVTEVDPAEGVAKVRWLRPGGGGGGGSSCSVGEDEEEELSVFDLTPHGLRFNIGETVSRETCSRTINNNVLNKASMCVCVLTYSVSS